MAMTGAGVTKTRRPAAVTHLFPGENQNFGGLGAFGGIEAALASAINVESPACHRQLDVLTLIEHCPA
jgi:hypothetical protein